MDGMVKEIYEKVIDKLKNDGIRRAIEDGRAMPRIKRGIEMTFSFYDKYDYPCIDTTEMEPSKVANLIIAKE